jgi:hypothetical protein
MQAFPTVHMSREISSEKASYTSKMKITLGLFPKYVNHTKASSPSKKLRGNIFLSEGIPWSGAFQKVCVDEPYVSECERGCFSKVSEEHSGI